MAQIITEESKKAPLLLTQDLINLYESAGLKVPGKAANLIKQNTPKLCLKEEIKKGLRILDETNAVHRYKAFNIPTNISSEELERMLYYKGQVCMFYCKALDDFFFMPFALDGNIDVYGRYFYIRPVPMTSGTTETPDSNPQVNYFSQLRLKVYYDIPYKDLKPEDRENAAVIFFDRTPQLSWTNIPRQSLQEPILDVMSECFPLMRTSLFNSTGVKGMRVSSGDEISNVLMANMTTQQAAIQGQQYVPIKGQIDFQELSGDDVARSEEFLMAMQALDNYRLSLLGLDSGGLFQKKSHMLEAEQTMNEGRSKAALIDGLTWRQRACDIATALWGTGMSYELSETATGVDLNFDGLVGDDRDQSGIPGDQNTLGGIDGTESL